MNIELFEQKINKMKLFKKILVANRGEIAVRVMRTAKKLGIATVAIYSEVDKESLHVSYADEAYCIGEVELSDTYLNINKIIDVAKKNGCDAIHPGYGFMAENSKFVTECNNAGIAFIGPNTESMRIMGNKIEARNFVKKLNVPLTEGVTGSIKNLISAAKKIKFPILIKAAAGGGGKGMRIVYKESELAEAIEATSREAKSYFGDETVYIEKFIEEPRHIEIQLLGDNFGNVIHLFERECSIQRRYQKIIEESPSPTITPEVRKKMGEAAVTIGKAIGYNNAGTIEFLVDKNLNFYFLEMNTRIQVEHPVTEMVTGIDIVEEQFYIAIGNPLRIKQEDVKQNGHAIECRIYAEDPSNKFLPSPGKMCFYKTPSLANIRIETGISKNTEIKSFFDPMLCKLIVWENNRELANQKMLNSLQEFIIHGINTNISYLIALLQNDAFINNTINTKFCDTYTSKIIEQINIEKEGIQFQIPLLAYCLYTLNNKNIQERKHYSDEHNVWNIIGYWREVMKIKILFNEKEYFIGVEVGKNLQFIFELNSQIYNTQLIENIEGKLMFSLNNSIYTTYISEDEKGNAFISYNGHIFNMLRKDVLKKDNSTFRLEDFVEDTNTITSPMPGKVIKINAKEGDEMKKGDVFLIIEAMKMENRIFATKDCKIDKINVKTGDMVESSTALITLN